MTATRNGPHQTMPWPPPAYEMQLARTLEGIYASGTHDLAGVVASLQHSTIRSPDGSPWTDESFLAALRAFGE